jgi:ribonuclease HII
MVGVDEVGRGCLAGPLLVVAARRTSDLPSGLKDSKLLTRGQREAFFEVLSTCCQFGEGWVSAKEIDGRGLGSALRLGVRRALTNLNCSVEEEIIMDGIVNYIPKKFVHRKCFAKADNNYPIVSAASIYAKVKRDAYMAALKSRYPKYKFEDHVGYGTAAHREALQLYGALKNIHRMSFNPLQVLGAEL